jgi:2-amino-4-hydroxy-6-hydroxymethyldihydropteridine diphosphokinase
MSIAYLSLGSNLGDRLEYLAEAVRRLDRPGATRVLQVSPVYETAPQGLTDQPPFLNIAVAVETSLSPEGLLAQIQEVEQGLGRVRTIRWGPRTVDIDIELYDEVTSSGPDLEIPHPRMTQRAFVLIPLLELKPDTALRGALERLPDQGVSLFLDAKSFLKRIRGVE